MKILTVTSGKGGVGKSTITLNIARQLSLGGKRTLLVDFDIHNKGVSGLFLPKIQQTSPSVTNIVAESSGFTQGNSPESVAKLQCIQITSDSNLFLLPASRPQEMIDWSNFHGAENAEIVQFFRTLLTNVAEHFHFDVIVIDCYGGIDSLTVAAVGVADDAIIVNEPDLITFSGTLQLFMYLRKQYSGTVRQPRLHFVVNRVTYRHSFAFLDGEYRKHLAKLAVDDKILAYFPYDKLLIETFGDYPFFTELLPRGLFTGKIRLLVESLWGDDPSYKGFSHLSLRKKKTVFQGTVENLFVDPDRILRAAVTLPFWLIVPSGMLFALYKGWGGSLHYRMIQLVFFTACIILAFLSLTIGCFEPIQISRWLWREATYHRRKRWLKKENGAVYRGLVSTADGLRALMPGIVGIIVLALSGYYTVKERSVLSKLSTSIWPNAVTGFKHGGDYTGLILRHGARLVGDDIANAKFDRAMLAGVIFDKVHLEDSSFKCADLSGSVFQGSSASGASFRCEPDNSTSRSTTTRLSEAQFKESNLTGVDFRYASLLNATFTDSALDHANFGCANLYEAHFKKSDATRLSATNASFHCEQRFTYMVGVTFDGVDLMGDDFTRVNLTGAHFNGSDLTGAIFTDASLSNGVFAGNSTLDNAMFGCANLFRVSFKQSTARNATFQCQRSSPPHPTSMVGAQFARVDLKGADFTNLRGADSTNLALSGSQFDEWTVGSMSGGGAIDRRIAESLKRQGAQIGTLPASIDQCNDADCEYSRAMQLISDDMQRINNDKRRISSDTTNLVESLILKGGQQNWEAAQARLNEIKTSPNFASDQTLKGEYTLLTLLLRVVSRQPDRGATNDWCDWRSRNRPFTDWSWNVWDHAVPKLHLSPEVLARVNAVEASAKGQPGKALCASDSK